MSEAEHLNVRREVPLSLATPEAEELMGVRRRDWRRLRRRVENLANPLVYASGWAATFLGVGIGLGASIVTVMNGAEAPEPWVMPLLATATFFAFVFAAFSYSVHRKMRKDKADEVQDVCADMDEIESRTPPVAQLGSASSG